MTPNTSHPDLSVRAYALVGRERTTRDFDDANAALLNHTLDDIGKVLSFKYMCILQGCDLGTEARFHSFALTKTSLDVLVSALHMARHRAGVETFALLRVALEAACTAHHIAKDETAYRQYLAGQYKSTRSITSTKTVIPCVGEVWGAFSRACVHTNSCVFGPRYDLDTDGAVAAEVRFDNSRIRPPTPRQDAVLLTAVSLVAMILLRILEDNTINGGSGNLSERHVVGTKLYYFHNTDERITHYYDALKESSQEG